MGRGAGEPLNAPGKPRYWAWADLMRRAFELDVLACPRCGGRMRLLLATIEDPRVIRRILARLRLRPEGPDPSPSRLPPGATGDLVADIPAYARHAAPALGRAPSRSARTPARRTSADGVGTTPRGHMPLSVPSVLP